MLTYVGAFYFKNKLAVLYFSFNILLAFVDLVASVCNQSSLRILQSFNVFSHMLIPVATCLVASSYLFYAIRITNTEKTSLNKNVLRKHYYIIIPYYASELGAHFADEEEKRNMIFSKK